MWLLHMPLAWLLGAMVSTGMAALLKVPVAVPAYARPPMTAMIGAVLGTSFVPSVFVHAGSWLITLAGLVLLLVAASSITYVYFRKIAGFDPATAYFSAMPGGLVEMVSLGAERGGDEKSIALVHASRIFLVVLALPFLIQILSGVPVGRSGIAFGNAPELDGVDVLWFLFATATGIGLGTLLRFPARYLLGPMLVSAGLHIFAITDFRMPAVVLASAQLVIGALVGCRFATASPRVVLGIIGLSLGSTILLLGSALAMAGLFSWLADKSFLALVLAYSPGGLAELSILALSLGIEVPFVVLHHIARVFLIVAGSTIMFRVVRSS